MAFSFGAAPTPAPSSNGGAGGFSFGSSSTTPAPSFGFGASAPSTTFGSTPAPSTTFGSTPAPSTAFGSTSFGSTPAPAFGSAPAGGFGSGGLFGGSNPAPAPFGAPQAASQPQQQAPQIKGTTPYADLSPQYKAAIDKIYNSMMEHKRTLLQVRSSGPAVLQVSSDTDGGPLETSKSQLKLQIEQISKQLHLLQHDLAQTTTYALKQKELAEEQTAAAYTFAKWPLEANAVRRGISLSTTNATTNEEKKDSGNPNSSQSEDANISIRLGELLDQATLHVDHIERMPSPYFWQTLDDFQRRILELQDQISLARHQIDRSRTRHPGSTIHVASDVDEQHRMIWSIGDRLLRMNSAVNEIRRKYQQFEIPGQNVLEKAKKEEIDRQQRLSERIQRTYMQSAQTPAPASSSSSTAPAPSSFGFSSSALAPSAFSSAPAPSAFSSAPAPSSASAPSSAFSFSGAPTPAPAPGGPPPAPSLFGGATTSTFGSSGSPAPAPGAFGFTSPSGATPTTPKKKSTSASRRLNRR